jgi:hypothetical protein
MNASLDISTKIFISVRVSEHSEGSARNSEKPPQILMRCGLQRNRMSKSVRRKSARFGFILE